jgi:uncharacterized membrane protein YfcA
MGVAAALPTSTRRSPRAQEAIKMAVVASAVVKAENPASRKTLWLLVGLVAVTLGVVLFVVPNNPDVAVGFSTRELVAIEAILFLSGTMSGLSGFGFSAVGAATLMFMPPVTEAPLLQTLSKANQLLSIEQLRHDMPKSWREFWAGPGFCILGGIPGAYAGIWMLSTLPAQLLMTVFGSMLVLYSLYSLFKPKSFVLKGCDGPIASMIVGFIGSAFGGFTAFPGAAVVVWLGLRNVPKEKNRAIVQPYIILSQVFSLILIAAQHAEYFSHRYWILLLWTLPAVLPGTLTGVMIYRRISDVNFRRISFILLGLSGGALLLRMYAPFLFA